MGQYMCTLFCTPCCLSLGHLHTLWRKKDYLSDVVVEEAERWAKTFGQCWKLMGWKATVWVHWRVCHSIWFVRKYRTIYFFSLVPTERTNSAYKVQIQNSLRWWSVKNPRVPVRGRQHLLNMYGLDVRLKCVASPSTGKGRGQKRKGVNSMALGKCLLWRHLCISRGGSEKSL